MPSAAVALRVALHTRCLRIATHISQSYTFTLFSHFNSMFIPQLHVYTSTPCLYLNSMFTAQL
jgi:hypothetical protein